MKLKNIFIHTTLIIVCILSLIPFLWLLSTALKGQNENIFAYPPVFIPKDFTLDNFKEVLKYVPIVKYVLNSFIVASFTVILNIILSAMAAYPLARMNFKGKKIAFFAIFSYNGPIVGAVSWELRTHYNRTYAVCTVLEGFS